MHNDSYLMHHGVKGMKWGNKYLGSLNSQTILTGTLALTAALSIYNNRKNTHIRASYMRDRGRKDERWAG